MQLNYTFQFIVVAGMASYKPMQLGSYVYPKWSNAVGWIIAASSMSMIPFYAIYKMSTLPGTFIQV